ncbi:MAG: replication-relaxation family protein [Acidimicrobiales bacterium]
MSRETPIFDHLDVLDRLRPQAWGTSAPYHWVLGPLGAAIVATEAGRDPADLTWRRRLARDLAKSQRLSHLVGTNSFFTALLRAASVDPSNGSGAAGSPTG